MTSRGGPSIHFHVLQKERKTGLPRLISLERSRVNICNAACIFLGVYVCWKASSCPMTEQRKESVTSYTRETTNGTFTIVRITHLVSERNHSVRARARACVCVKYIFFCVWADYIIIFVFCFLAPYFIESPNVLLYFLIKYSVWMASQKITFSAYRDNKVALYCTVIHR